MKAADIKAGEFYVIALNKWSKQLVEAREPITRTIYDRVTYKSKKVSDQWQTRNEAGRYEETPNRMFLAPLATWEELHPEEAKAMKDRWLYYRWQQDNKQAYAVAITKLEDAFSKSGGIRVSPDYTQFNVSIAGPLDTMLARFPELAEIVGEVKFTPVPTGEEPLV